MVSGTILVTGAIIALASRVSAHASIFTPSMLAFNKTDTNRPQDPLMNLPFNDWWFHGHLGYLPHPNDIEQLPVGGTHNFPTSCDKDATIYWESGPGGNQQDPSNPDWPCPGQPSVRFHANNISDTAGCALGVAYKSEFSEVKPEDFVIFSVNHTCVWYLNTYFEIPERMPVCPDGKCICAWFWIHNMDSGSEQMYMTGFQCNMTGATSTDPLPPPQLPRRCGYDKFWDTPADPANCTLGPKSPMYWYQAEGNNMPEDTYHAPTYSDVYGFHDGRQDDIFWVNGDPSNQTYNTSSRTPSDSTTSPMPSNNPPAINLASSPPPSSYSSSYPPASSPPPSSSSYSPDPSMSSPSSYPPAGNMDPTDTSPTPSMSTPMSMPSMSTPMSMPSMSTPSSVSYPPPSSQSSQPPSSSPPPTNTMDPEYQSKPSSKPPNTKTCRHRPKSSSAYLPTPSPSPMQNYARRANTPAHRRASSLEDAPAARRVWGHHRRGVDNHNA